MNVPSITVVFEVLITTAVHELTWPGKHRAGYSQNALSKRLPLIGMLPMSNEKEA